MVGESLLHYRIVDRLGEGGMGEVYLAEDTKLDRQVAIKLLPPEVAADAGALARFEREAKTVASLNHPNIVTLHSVESDTSSDTGEPVHFLTMERVEGETLDSELRPGGMELKRFFELAVPIATAVAAAHAHRVTHRDLKPGNVMVTPESRVKVLDFGLAKVEAPIESGDSTATLTRDGALVGTFAYMSPEQAKAASVDLRSDVFSLGVLLFEMATGRKPFEGEGGVELLSAILKDEPPAVTDLRPELPNHLSRIIRRCLEKDPGKRYQSALEVRNELQDLELELGSPGWALSIPRMRLDPRWRPLVASPEFDRLIERLEATGVDTG